MASSTQKVALSTVAQVVGRITQLALGLISVKILTQYLGVSGYGEYTIIFAYSGLAAVFADFGTTTLIIRELSQQKARLGDLIGSGFVVNCIVGLITALIFAGLLVFFPYAPHVKLGVLLALLSVFVGNLNIYGSYFSYKIRLDLIVLIETSGRLVNILLLLWLVSIHAPFLWIIAATPFSFVYNATIGTLLVLKDKIGPRVDWKLVRYIFWHSVPIGIVAVLSVAQTRIDTVILSVMKSATDVGIYGIAGKLTDLLVVIPSFFMAAIYPVLSAAYHSGEDFRTKSRLAFDFILIIGLPAVVGAFMLAPELISLIGNSKYIAAAVPLQILTVSVFFGYLTLYHNTIAFVVGLQKKMVWRSAVTVAVNIVANLMLIPILSYNGAAIASVISSVVGLVLIVDLVSRNTTIERSLRRLPRVIMAVGAMAGTIYFIHTLNVVVAAAIASGIYFAGLVLSKAITAKEIKTILPESLIKKLSRTQS